jgi:N-acetyl-gamma-glutamyl-phosphate reductase
MAKEKIKIAVAGSTGYGGLELVRLLAAHPRVQVTYLASTSSPGKHIDELYPHLAEIAGEDFDGLLKPLDPAAMAAAADVALLALPAGKSAPLVPQLLAAGMKVIDGGPDFRLQDPAAYAKWYKFEHPASELLTAAVYGIPEFYREGIKKARLVAGPGCYPTAALLALRPLVKAGLLQPEIIVDAKSGLSGAGRTALKVPNLYTEATGDVSAYSLPAHRHLPEMVQELETICPGKDKPEVYFTPHLVPMARGIFATCYAGLVKPAESAEGLLRVLGEFYAGSPFVHITEEYPHTKWTVGTNQAFISARLSADGKKVILLSVIDNLGKGLSSQMVQCLNIMSGLEEIEGLRQRAVYP